MELIATTDCQAQAEALAASGIPYDGELVDMGASRHFSPARSKMINFVNIKPTPIRTADGHSFDAIGRGDYVTYLPMGHGKTATKVTLYNTYYSPHLAFTLISVSCLDTAGYSLTVEDGNCYIKTPKPNRHVIGIVPKVNGLYRIQGATNHHHSKPLAAAAATPQISISQFHRIMGHASHESLKQSIRNGEIITPNVNLNSEPEFCSACVQAKAATKPFPKHSDNESAKKYGDKVTGDIWGPAEVKSIGGSSYFALFKDVATRERLPYFMKKKSETLRCYKEHEAWMKAQRGVDVVKIFGSDRGGEFTSEEFKRHLKSAGTIRHLNVHDSPSSNGMTEREMRTVLEGAQAMIIAAGMPNYLWAEAVAYHCWLRNRLHHSALADKKMTPHEKATQRSLTCPICTNLGVPYG